MMNLLYHTDLLAWVDNNTPERAQARKSGPISLIIPDLYLGTGQAASEAHTLQERRIRAVVNVGGGLDYHNLNLLDHNDALQVSRLPAITDVIHTYLTRRQPVFVHCVRGISRSPSVVIAYLIRYREVSFSDAMAVVQARRSSAVPKPAYRAALEAWAQSGDARAAKPEAQPPRSKRRR